MNAARQNIEVAAQLFCCILKEVRIRDHSGTMLIGRHRCDKELLICRVHLRHHAAAKHLVHHLRHAANLRRTNLRCIYHCIGMKLFSVNAELLHQIIGNQQRVVAARRLSENQTIHHCHILHLLVRNLLQKICISLGRHHLHRELVLHLIVINDVGRMERRDLLYPGFNLRNRPVQCFLVAKPCVMCLENGSKIQIHANVAALRCDAQRVIGLVQLFHMILT